MRRRRDTPGAGEALVLCYHAVSERWPSELAVHPARLERQLRLLLARGYRPVTFSAALRAAPGERLLAVTFDDGFQSTVAEGLPILRRLGIPATAFVASAFVGQARLAWPGIERWLEGPYSDELQPVSWASLRLLLDAGWEIGSHSLTHADLTRLSDARLEEELQGSRATLRAQLGVACRSLAYPYGALDARVTAAARAAGYESAAALPLRLDDPDPLRRPRIGIYRMDGAWRFRAKVCRACRALRRTRAAAPLLAAHELSRSASRSLARPSADRPGVLASDAEERSIVALVRGLGRGGYRVGATAAAPRAAAQWSRLCEDSPRIPDPLRDEAGFVDGLEGVLRGGRYEVFIPGSDPVLLIASRQRARLERYVRMGLPPHATVLRSLDKLALPGAAAGTGLDVPDTVSCETPGEALRAARELGFPVVLKPRSSVFESAGGLRHMPGRIVHDETELRHAVPAYGERCLLQRYEQGELLAYGGVRAGGRLLASALARSWRTHRLDGGSLAFAEAIAVPASLRAGVAQLLQRVGHEGIFELDLLLRADGSTMLLDLNPRPYGAMALALRGGANLPRIWCDWLLGGSPRPVEAQPGVFYRWEDADLFHLAGALRERRPRAAAAVLVPHRRVAHAYLSLTDPGPFAARALWLAEDFARHGLSDRRELALPATHGSPAGRPPRAAAVR